MLRFTTRWRLHLSLVLVLAGSCGLAAWVRAKFQRENARLKAELLQERGRTRALRGLVDTLQAKSRRPPAPPAPPIITL